MNELDLPRQRAMASLKAMFVGDSLSMPVHWYYNPINIYQQFSGGISALEAAPAIHPSSIMSLHSTSAGGRRRSSGTNSGREIIGDVILKGKRKFWGKPNQHYHQGMQAGENTLNAHCTRLVMRTLSANKGHYDKQLFLDAYISFMTADTPLHPDTYAESYHRGFFANLESGKSADQCGAVTHDTASIGGLVTIAPIVFSERLAGTSIDDVQAICREHLLLTHPDESLAKICTHYVALLDSLLFNNEQQSPLDLFSHCAKASIGLDLPELLKKSRGDNEVIGGLYSPACYITGSWPGVLYLAGKYTDEIKKALLANANLGGDNAHRGIVLGALLGLATSHTADDLFDELVDAPALEQEIASLVCGFPD